MVITAEKMVDLFIYRELEISSIQSIFCWKFCLEDSHRSKFPYSWVAPSRN